MFETDRKISDMLFKIFKTCYAIKLFYNYLVRMIWRYIIIDNILFILV